MQAVNGSNCPANENVRGLRLALYVTDGEVIAELEERADLQEREAFAKHALRIGVLALRQAHGALDAQAIQRESERMLASIGGVLSTHATQTTAALAKLLAGYLDPTAGTLPQRLERLTKRDGELESLLAKHLDGERSTIARTLARQVGEESAIFKLLSPTQAGGLVTALTTAIDEALGAQREELLRQFSLDRSDSALSRLVTDISTANGKLRGELARDVGSIANALSLNDKASPLSRLRDELLGAVTSFTESNSRFHSDVRTTLEAFRVRRAEAARSSTHGHSFEHDVEQLLQVEVRRVGDVCERLAGTPGSEGRKVGDYVITMGPETAVPGARIVVECKADKGYTEAKALEELGLARKNREAQVGIFVIASESARAFGAVDAGEPLRRLGMDILVVWDAEDPATDVYLRGALSIARALMVMEHGDSRRAKADVHEIEDCVRGVERMITAVDGIAHDAQLVVKRGTKIGRTAATLRERLEQEVERLRGVVEGGMGR